MAVTRQANLLSQQRLDIPHLRAIESSVAADFDVLAGRSWGGQAQLVVRGFTLGNIAVNTPAVSLQLSTADSIAFNSQATESGTMLWVPADRATETLNPVSNSKISGGWTPSTTNYVGLDFVRSADASTTDLVQFLDAVSGLETPKQVPLARTLDYRIVIGTVPFSGQPNLVPIAKVTLNGSSQVTAVEDARPLMFRLGQGGDSPNKYGFFGGWTRKENFGTLDSSLFTGGDKGIGGLKSWQDAVMTRLWEVGGGEFWYSATADRNVHMVTAGLAMANGDYWTWTLGTQTLQWQGIMLLFDNSTAYRADVNNGSISPLLPGECLYVDLDRTKFYVPAWLASTAYAVGDLVVNGGNAYETTVAGTSAGAGGPTGTGSIIVDGTVTWKYVGPGQAGGLTMQKAALQTLGPGALPGSRWILAWRRGGDVFSRDWRYPVGTLFIPATTTAQGVVKITRDHTGLDTVGASALNDPKALSDRGGTITVPAVGNVGVKIKRFDAGADILQWRTAADAALGNIDNDGDINFAADAREIAWPSWRITSTAGTGFRIQNVADGDQRMDLNGNYNEFRDSSGTRAVRFSVGPAGVLFGSLTSLPIFFESAGNTWWKITDGTGQLSGLISTGIDIANTAQYKYTTARTALSKHYSAADFQLVDSWGNSDSPNVRVLSQQFPTARTAGWVCSPRFPGQQSKLLVKAPLNLPHGASITGVTVMTSADDGGTSVANTFANARLNVYRRTFSAGTATTTRLNTTGSVNYSGTGGASLNETTFSFAHTVDNSGTGHYELEIDLNSQWNWTNFTGAYASINGGAAMALLPDGRVLIAGGYSGSTAIATAKIYDPYTGSLTTVTSMNNARAGHKMAAIRTSLQGLKIIAFGGHNGDGSTRVQTCEIYDAEANTWTNLSGSMTNAVGFQWIMHPRGDQVIVVSGSTAGQENTALSINDSSVVTLASTNSNRVGCALAWYSPPTGSSLDKVFLAAFGGGANFSSPTNTWESYDPYADTWTNGSGTMTVTRNLAGAHTLPDGSVVIAGGSASASAEKSVAVAAHSTNFTALTAPPINFVTGQTFMLPDLSLVFLSGGSAVAQLFTERGTGGTWSRLDSVTSGALVSDQTGVGGNAGQNLMLPTGELIGIAQQTIAHLMPGSLHYRPAMRVPTLRFHGLRVNYDYSEVNVEM